MRWWHLPTCIGPGQAHMARDEALLEAHRRGQSPSVFYLSLWAPATLSVGFHQRLLPTTPWVRRPTGGRSVWHGGDITYTFVTSGLTGTVLDSYHQLSAVLIHGLGSLGVDLSYGEKNTNYHQQSACFALKTGADLCWQGHKVVGSAQLRRGEALLQQGSILLQPDYVQLAQLFPGVALPIRGLEEILGHALDSTTLAQAVNQGLTEVLGAQVIPMAWEAVGELYPKS